MCVGGGGGEAENILAMLLKGEHKKGFGVVLTQCKSYVLLVMY